MTSPVSTEITRLVNKVFSLALLHLLSSVFGVVLSASAQY